LQQLALGVSVTITSGLLRALQEKPGRLHIQILDLHRVGLDELAAALDVQTLTTSR
jgi:hypothetical protein